ncbi:OsmC family protein [Sorangium sp. So ce1014]|uniref:OsmC family protein n=1 Tax=Sorangium sp. So ce1014 TaxID=3133326 RepID=UPI003F640F07
MTIHCEAESPGELVQYLHVRGHIFCADVPEAAGGRDFGLGPHDYFDAALAACKTLTATLYAEQKGIALERVEAHVERDDNEERRGKSVLKIRLASHGPLTEAARSRLHAVIARCLIHELMTTADVVLETAHLEGSFGASVDPGEP